MEKIVKHSAWGIVLDPKAQKIVLTKKLSKYEIKAKIIKSLFNLLRIDPETAIKVFKGWLTKGKIEEWHSKAWTACNEIREEWGVNPRDFIFEKNLWTFTKNKRYGLKEVEMFLYTTQQKISKLEPTDTRHIAAFIDIAEAPKLMQSKEEKAFLLSVQEEIEKVLTNYDKIHHLPITETVGHVAKIDAGIVR